MRLLLLNTNRWLAFLRLAAAVWLLAGLLSAAGQSVPVPSAPNPAPTNSAPANVMRPAHRLEEAELRDLLTRVLNRSRGGGNAEWELHFTRQWTPITVPGEPLSLNLLEPALERISSSCILRFELRAGRELVGTWQVPVQARLWRDIPITRSTLQRGQPLSEAEFGFDRRDLLALRDPLAELPTRLERYEAAENIPAGAPLSARAVRLKAIISRGQLADAIVQDGAMIISLKVEVLDDGMPGQIIRVRNLQSRRELRGKVQDEKTIAITL